MATRYLSGVLKGLDNIFNFRDSQKGAPGDVELDLPIQPVVDTSRIAMYGSGLGSNVGWYLVSITNAHTVVGVLQVSVPVYSPAFSKNTYPATISKTDFMAWYYSCWATMTDGTDFNAASVTLQHQSSSVGPTGITTFAVALEMMQRWNEVRGTSGGVDIAAQANEPPTGGPDRPVPLPGIEGDPLAATRPAILFTTEADSNGTNTVTGNARIWVGAKLALPPGR